MAADIKTILYKLSDLGYIRLNREMGQWFSIYCPFHNDGNEKKPSCGVALYPEIRAGVRHEAGTFHCFSCSAVYSLVDGVTQILKNKQVPKSGLEWLKENIPGFEVDETEELIPEGLADSLINKYAISQLSQKPQSFVSEEELAGYRYTVPYMYQRKMTDAIIEKYDVGVDLHWIPPGRKKEVPCITIPVRDRQGRTLFLCRRSIEGKMYNYPEGVLKPVFGVDQIPQGCRSVIICESAINAITAEVYGYDAVALLGTGNAYQVQQLKELGVSEFVICTDGDEAGRKAAQRLKKSLSSVALVWIVPMPDGKDLNDLSQDEFNEVYSRRE